MQQAIICDIDGTLADLGTRHPFDFGNVDKDAVKHATAELVRVLGRAFDAGTTEIAAMAVTVDALHDRARAFSERYGFQQFLDNEYRLFLPMETIALLLAEAV